MNQRIMHMALVVDDYDEAVKFYTEKLHFRLIYRRHRAERDKKMGTGSTTRQQRMLFIIGESCKRRTKKQSWQSNRWAGFYFFTNRQLQKGF